MKNPMSIITLDFETYFTKQYSLSKMTTQAYINDLQFETIGVAVKRNSKPTKWFSGSHEDTKLWLSQIDWDNAVLVAHNAMFDASILSFIFDIHPKKIVDTLSMARALHGVQVGGSLAALAKHYQIGEKGTEVLNALGKHRKDFTKEELTKYGAYCVNDVDLTYEIFMRMQGAFDKTEASLIDMTIKMHTRPTFWLDTIALEEHLVWVRCAKDSLLDAVATWLCVQYGCKFEDMDREGLKKELMSNPKFATLLERYGVEPPMKTSPTTGKLTYAFAKSDEDFKALQEHESIEIQTLVAARLGLKSTLEETRTQRFLDIASTLGTLPVPLKYYGAMTGRWAASDSINLQNLPRKSKLKEAITAPLGHVIVGADLSNIELRVGLYFADQQDKLGLLGDGLDLYKDFAAGAFKVAYDQVTDEERFVGKTAQLSLIYGTGAKKLRAQCKMLSGKDIGESFAQEVVDLYRTDYANVKSSWADAEELLNFMYAYKSEDYPADTNFGKGTLSLPVYSKRGIKLPSGLFLSYPDLLKIKGEFTYKSRGTSRARIHGPKMFQNTIQALARCVMGEAMVRIHKRYPVALTIHDACYLVVPEAEADTALKFVIQELKREPAWAPGIPLDAEGGYGNNLSFKMGKVKM